uniref:Uncharacterized protein n=1 Tax=Acrobeloides nanus TaxID=290746 RepID=A0A914BW42_9BILA
MEVKRRRLEVKPSETNSSENPSPLVDQLSSNDDNVVLKTLMQLKKKFNTSDEVTSFLSSNQQFIQTLLVVTKRYFSNLSIQVEAIKLRIIKESIAVLANCCYLSLSACVKIMQPGLQFGLLAVRILESGDRTDVSIKASILRLIANICRDSQLAKTIASISTLLDRIMMSIIIETSEISGQALRIVGLLAKNPTQAKVSFNEILIYLFIKMYNALECCYRLTKLTD